MLEFIRRHVASVMGTLSGLDRIRFRGTLRGLVRRAGVSMLLRSRGLRMADFKAFAQALTDQLGRSTVLRAEQKRRPYRYLNSPAARKELIARQIAEQDDPREQQRRSAAITPRLRLLRAHGLIHKLPHTHRYRISPRGQAVLAALLAARRANPEKLTAAA